MHLAILSEADGRKKKEEKRRNIQEG